MADLIDRKYLSHYSCWSAGVEEEQSMALVLIFWIMTVYNR